MPLPPCWVVAAAIAADSCPIQYTLDALTHAAGRLGLVVPDRLEHTQDCRRVDDSDRQIAQRRVGVAAPADKELLTMTRGAPFCFVGSVVGFGGFLEGQDNDRLRALGAPRINRVQ